MGSACLARVLNGILLCCMLSEGLKCLMSFASMSLRSCREMSGEDTSGMITQPEEP